MNAFGANTVVSPALRAPRANPVFDADGKRIRIKNTVADKSEGGFRLVLIQVLAMQFSGFYFFFLGAGFFLADFPLFAGAD
ncbi:MAG: hypothetical protein IH605_00395 [Burkholderiales bacterium]|nr:hypothetical protein [Burkholderiales bacterium]